MFAAAAAAASATAIAPTAGISRRHSIASGSTRAAHRHASRGVRCNSHDHDWPAPAIPPRSPESTGALSSPRSLDQTHERRNIRSRAIEIANMDPNDPRALDFLGSHVPCKVRFNVPYDTKMGEEVFIIGSNDKLGAWNQDDACPMTWGEGGNWYANLELPASGVFFYKYVVRTIDGGFKWQEGANNLLVLPDPWDIPEGSVFLVEDSFSGLSRSSQNQLAVKLIQTEKNIVQLKMETYKAKEMTKASLQELLITREQLSEANLKLEHYERNVQTVISSMQQTQTRSAR
mmetsp:Transcript_28889/g.72290  ORF Transcript_28889/g.72290 Transcript_28889/m.72290 type:complete len:289 (-) Transcript_28889:636-1502(-)